MALSTKHPLYIDILQDWQTMHDVYRGERIVKERGQRYLPVTPSQQLDGMEFDKPGFLAYQRYKERAIFWDYVSDGVESLIGLLHQKSATIELPDGMKGLLTKASREGETLEQLLRRINEHQLVYGRLGLLLDFNVKGEPYVALYKATSVTNWDDSADQEGINQLQLVVLNESAYQRNSEFAWVLKEKYRVLQLSSTVMQPVATENMTPPLVATGSFVTGVFNMTDGMDYNPDNMKPPVYQGVPCPEIPFEFINSKDLIATPDNPPLLGLANLVIAIYRAEADYRQSLFLQGQDTLVVVGGSTETIGSATGEDTALRVGAGAKIDVNIGGDAKYIGVSSLGLPEQRMALENDKLAASTKAAQLVSPQAGKQESGDALHTRLAAQTATLKQIALTGAAGLEALLKTAARWMSMDETKVVVTPNLEFVDQFLSSKDLADLMDARTKGAPISLESIHDLMASRDLTDKTFEEEMAQVKKEAAMPGTQPPVVTPPVKGAPGTGTNGSTGATGS
jgi:hypothetical protein